MHIESAFKFYIENYIVCLANFDVDLYKLVGSALKIWPLC